MPELIKKMNSRHHIMATLLAAGLSREEVAKQCGVRPETVSVVQRSPLMKAIVAKLQAELAAQTIGRVADRLTNDADKNLSFIQSVRDRSVEGGFVKDEMPYRMKAAEMLFDRQVPRRTEATLDATHRILIEKDDADLLDDVTIEIGEEDVARVEVREESVGLETLDQVKARLAADV